MSKKKALTDTQEPIQEQTNTSNPSAVPLSEDPKIIQISVSGYDIDHKVAFFQEECNILEAKFVQILSLIVEEKATEPLLQSISEKLSVQYQKLAKWKEVQAYYNLTTNVEVLGKKMSLVEAENSIIPFQKMQNIWTNFIHQTETQNLLARLLKEPSIPTATEQRKNFAKVVGVFQTAVQKARSTVITVTMSKDFLE